MLLFFYSLSFYMLSTQYGLKSSILQWRFPHKKLNYSEEEAQDLISEDSDPILDQSSSIGEIELQNISYEGPSSSSPSLSASSLLSKRKKNARGNMAGVYSPTVSLYTSAGIKSEDLFWKDYRRFFVLGIPGYLPTFNRLNIFFVI